MKLKPAVLDIIARISSRIYLGDELCRNEDWLKITKTYTTTFYTASTRLRMIPTPFRRLAHWFMPECKRLREQMERSRQIIQPLVERRRALKIQRERSGEPVPRFNDALGWAEDQARDSNTEFDPVIAQLTLSLLAIHTTYDLLQQCVLDLAQNPHYTEPLRQEVIKSVRQYGWTKQGLYQMQLLDSAIKESQRLKPGSLVTMRRYVTEDIVLSNGLVLKKGTRINVDTSRMRDPSLHESPDTYDAFRFYRMRMRAGGEHIAQLSSTSSDHLGFGHGEHSCPGRFFAANEIKVALAQMLMKYEWKLSGGTTTAPDVKGMLAKSSSVSSILIRKRNSTGDLH